MKKNGCGTHFVRYQASVLSSDIFPCLERYLNFYFTIIRFLYVPSSEIR